MAITRVAVAGNADTGGGDAVLTLTMPTGIQAGDGALLAFTCASSAATVTITSNGLSVTPVSIGAGVASFSGHSSRLWALNNLAAADSGKVLTFTASTALKMSVAVVVYRGVNTTNLVDQVAAKTSTVGTTTPTNPAVTTGVANAGVASFWFPTRGTTVPQIVTVTPPTGETTDVTAFTTEASGANGVFASHDSFGTGNVTAFRTWAAAATTTPVTYTLDQSAVYSAWTVSLVPSVSSAGPTVDAGGAQTVPAGGTVTLAGTDTPAAGTTISSRQWTALTYPGTTAPTLTGAATATASFTSAPGTYTFRYRVTDSTGTFSDATVTVYATTTNARPIATTAAGAWTAVGAATIDATLADESDTTYAESVDNPAGSSFTVDLPPAPVGAKTLTYRLAASAAPGGTVLVEYLSAGTVVASWNETVTNTTPTTFTHTLTDVQNASVTNQNARQLRFTGSV